MRCLARFHFLNALSAHSAGVWWRSGAGSTARGRAGRSTSTPARTSCRPPASRARSCSTAGASTPSTARRARRCAGVNASEVTLRLSLAGHVLPCLMPTRVDSCRSSGYCSCTQQQRLLPVLRTLHIADTASHASLCPVGVVLDAACADGAEGRRGRGRCIRVLAGPSRRSA